MTHPDSPYPATPAKNNKNTHLRDEESRRCEVSAGAQWVHDGDVPLDSDDDEEKNGGSVGQVVHEEVQLTHHLDRKRETVRIIMPGFVETLE